ncbi:MULTISPECIES: helix-turn-helix transcriptional regulator [Actinomyces]|uniref:WYL domain-containing protein n=1 Tax=Actinomyces respiraculi TaxID=2744574 RepID=A0A7T0PWD3_9ACTO|nr:MULTISPECIES: WYL domain-containing protein [Actinomyces]QPL04435.1 WYL domain-containing protein [Actinomyces respiraculi]
MARPSSTDRLLRLLALPAWVSDHPGATLAQAAAQFGVTEGQLRRDVETLWVSGLPGGTPDLLVDFDADLLDEGRLRLTAPLGLDRPVTLTREEGTALLLSLRVLARLLSAVPGATAPLRRAEQVLSDLLEAPVQAVGESEDPVLAAVTRALAEGRRLHLVYASATDERSERDVDPFEIVSDGSHLSLRAWCTHRRAERTFRLDRILQATVTEQAAAPHRRLRAQGLERLADREEAQTAELHLAPAGRWLVEQAGCERVEEHPDGTLTATVRGRSRDWLVGLVLSAGRHVLDVSPPELREEAAARARAALALAQGDRQGDSTS